MKKKPASSSFCTGFFFIFGLLAAAVYGSVGSTAEYEITPSSPHTPIIVFLTDERAYYTAGKKDGSTNHYQAVCVARQSYNFNVVKQMSHGGRPEVPYPQASLNFNNHSTSHTVPFATVRQRNPPAALRCNPCSVNPRCRCLSPCPCRIHPRQKSFFIYIHAYNTTKNPVVTKVMEVPY